MRATVRWALADLRKHRGEAAFIVLATAGVIASLLLAGALFSYATNPWQRLFTQTSGAHVWIRAGHDAHTEKLADLGGVKAVSGPFATARATVGLRGTEASVELRGADSSPPGTARPAIEAGSWLGRGPAEGIVLESSLAGALWAEPGDSLTVRGTGGTVRTLRVVGVADSAERTYSPGETPGVGWVRPGTLDRIEPHREHGQTIGLRLDNPDDTDFMVQRAVTELGADQVTAVSRWQQARADAEGDNRLLGLLLGLFGLGALLAAALALVGAISTRVRGHLRDIAVLKAIGFTPAQVVRMFLVEHLVFALSGVTIGAVLTEAVGAKIPGQLGEAMRLWQSLPGHAWAPLAIASGAVLFIGAATGLAAWRAGRVPPVPVARAALPAGRRMSRIARWALGLRIPPALVLGWRGAFPRPVRSWAAVGRLAVPLLLITVALGAWATLDRFERHPEQGGFSAGLTARAGDELGDAAARKLLTAGPDVAAAYPGVEVEALVPGQTGTITLRGLGTARDPYPFPIAEGRPAHGPDEAVAGQGLLDLLNITVGDWVRMTVEGRPQILHIVGRTIEPEEGGRVISTTVDTLRERDGALEPDFYRLALRPGADQSAVSAALVRSSGGRLDVREVPNPADRLSAVRGVIIGLVAVLVLIALAELSTTVGAGVRDRRRDLLALKAIGLSPRQITAVIVAGSGFTALAAAVIGTGLGVAVSDWLIDVQGRSSGMGAGIAATPSPGSLLLLVVAAMVLAVAASTLPAAKAARRRLADTLSDSL